MRNFFVLAILTLSTLAWAWQKQGTLAGNITDVEVIQWDGDSTNTTNLVYVSTAGSGIFKSVDGGDNWIEANGWAAGANPLPDLKIKAIASLPGKPDYLVAISDYGVWLTGDEGANWSSLAGTNLPSIYRFTDIAVASSGGDCYFILGTYGRGVWWRTDGNATWTMFDTGVMKDYADYGVLSVGANLGPGSAIRILAGTDQVSSNALSGHLYYMSSTSDTWHLASGTGFINNTAFPAISFRQSDYALVSVGRSVSSGLYGGVWYTPYSGYGTMTQLNSAYGMPTTEGFLSLDYIYFTGTGRFAGAGGTGDGLWVLPKPGSTGSYQKIPFKGVVTGVGVGNPKYCDVFFGGPGKGPFRTELCSPGTKPVPKRTGITDMQVRDIAASSKYGESDYGIFAASGIDGLFKNQEPFDAGSGDRGTFTRMIGNITDDGIPTALCTAVSPNYFEGGDINAAEQTVIVGTQINGLLKSADGGRSWFNPYANSTQYKLPDGPVTAVSLSPNYYSDSTLYAAVYGSAGGVYVSINGGADWSPLGGTGLIANKNVTSLALDPNYSAAQKIIYAGCRGDGSVTTAYKYQDGWYALTGLTANVNSLAAGVWSSTLNLYAATESQGLRWWTGSAWGSANWGLPSSTEDIHQIRLSPNYSSDVFMIMAMRPNPGNGLGGFYRYDHVQGKWLAFNTGLPDLRVLSVGLARGSGYPGSLIMFCGHATYGIFTTKMNIGGTPVSNWLGAYDASANPSFYTTPKRINGVAPDPNDPSIVLGATDDMGIMISLDGGFTFRPWSNGLTYGSFSGGQVWVVPRTLSVTVTTLLSGTSRRAVCGTAGHGIYYVDYDPSNPSLFYYPQWHSAAMSPASSGDVNELRYSEKVLLSENFEGAVFPPAGWIVNHYGSGGQNLTWTNQNPASAGCSTRAVSPPLSGKVAMADSDCDGSGSTMNEYLWTPVFTPSLTGITTLTLDFDHYFYHYSADYGFVYLYRPSMSPITLASFSGTSYGPQHVTIDLTPYLQTGMQLAFNYQGSYDWWWMVDNIKITANKSADLRAADTVDGDYHSADYGVTWSQVAGIPAGVGLTDLNYTDGGVLSLAGPGGRGMGGFTWGCSSGKSVSFRSGSCSNNGKAWMFNGSAWSACPATGLNTCEDFRAILKLSTGALLLGSKDIGGGSSWTGLYRSDDGCNTWRGSAEGLPANPLVWAFQELSSGDILAGLEGPSGGVYLSDSSSGGRAWVQYNSGFSPSAPDTVDLAASGGTVYTGMGKDGIYADSSALAYSGTPTAYFTPVEACVNVPVTFHDYSAGRVSAWSWTFGDGGTSSLQNPTHTYAAAGSYSNVLQASNGSANDYYPTNPENSAFQVKSKLDAGNTLRAAKVNSTTVNITWTDLNQGETGYQVWASNSAASGSAVGASLGIGASSTTLSGYTYFRIQPVSTTHVCGNGVVGGSW